MFAIVEISGRQFKVEPKLELKIPHQTEELGKKIVFDQVLLLDNEKNVKVGTPVVPNAMVEATILEHGRDKKVVVFKMKRRKGYKKKNTHRQEYTIIRIDSIKEKVSKSTRSTSSAPKGKASSQPKSRSGGKTKPATKKTSAKGSKTSEKGD